MGYHAGLGMNLATPEAALSAMSFLPRFVTSGMPRLPAMAGLAALWAVHEVGHYGVYVWCGGRLRTVFCRAAVRRRLEAVSGGVLVALGVRTASEGRVSSRRDASALIRGVRSAPPRSRWRPRRRAPPPGAAPAGTGRRRCGSR